MFDTKKKLFQQPYIYIHNQYYRNCAKKKLRIKLCTVATLNGQLLSNLPFELAIKIMYQEADVV